MSRFIHTRTLTIAALITVSALAAGCAGEAESVTPEPVEVVTESPSQDQDGAAKGTDVEPPTPPGEVFPFEEITPGIGEGLKIGFIQLNLASPFPSALQSGMQEAAEEAGIELITCDSKFDTPTALDCARQMATQKVDGQITFQGDAAAAPSICDAGPDVPVIAIDIDQGPCQTAFVGAANEYAGELVGYHTGLYMAANFDCEYDAYLSLESTAVGQVNAWRMDGTRKGFESVCGPIHDDRTLDTGAGGQTTEAQRLVTDTLTALPGAERIIVVGINEDVIVGALAAARQQDRVNDLFLGVQNLDPENCSILTAPNWIGSVAYFPEKYPLLILPNLVKAIKGEQIPEQILVPHEFIGPEQIKDFYPEYACS
ncbi:sugar ABC transporter substrate-binding protein [Tessaracoccus sp. OS52]|uniref:sugar ABC transporter substrate-binding protein n=1 Tax=Tessaracoccus sp. OS52 TaxID=2886691 RepID=UPI001D0FFE4E|nr:sugar ABC transporter substrate-binding protein [Tessaracoccus sp. OS52]MCC2591858.1 sugar ABC transporter substrate-binding protein [Tessaracoccus sp. OS52]